MIAQFLFVFSIAVPQDTAMTRLPSVEVSVSREVARSVLELPFALSRVMPDSTRPGLRNASIDERLFMLPGVTIANRNNPTQDPRISIRGFGSRSAFGVRGVRVQMDGVPLTLPDGQTAIDYLDLESIGSLELIRGSAASLYGNAAGGVIDLRSRPAPNIGIGAMANAWMAGYGQQKFAASAGGTSGNSEYAFSLSRLRTDGVRDHSRQQVTNGSLRFSTLLGGFRISAGVLAHDMPLAENPGALTLAEMRNDIGSAEPLAVTRKARKEVSQVQGGLTIAAGSPARGELELILHGGARDLNNPLQFAIVNVERASHGLSLRGSRRFSLLGREGRVTGGVDYQKQNDDRTEFTNCNVDPPLVTPTATCPELGVERGSLRRDQREIVSSIGPYMRGEIALSERILVSAGVRSDRVKFEVEDAFVNENNPDDSGERALTAISPTVGLVYRMGGLSSIYTNFSTAFETPTATELGNQPDGSAGFNGELDPQRSATFEVGTRGWLQGWWPAGLNYDFAVYRTAVDDELISFEIPGGAGRRFFRNAGSTTRTGFEASLGTGVGPAELALAYTYSHFLFDEYAANGTTYDGNRIPGIPVQQLHGAVTLRRAAWYLVLEGEGRAGVFIDDANSARAPGYEVMNVRVGGSRITGARWLSPRVGVQNVFDRQYAASIIVNASGGRYLEPAPGRVFFAGLTIGGM